ncbi:PEP-CTERM sorting domain-containing protein [Roseateles sp. UC29_93]|uniref:PEP-CTERM sorting domain-containing protein n=1 Tax=Roseateles sp. UC29_93 TaxID=3350177 RepID=UPI00366B24F2
MRIATRVSRAFTLRRSLVTVPGLLAMILVATGSGATAATYSGEARSEARTLNLIAPVDARSVVDNVPTGTLTSAEIAEYRPNFNGAESSSSAGGGALAGLVFLSANATTRTIGHDDSASIASSSASARLTDSFIIHCGGCADGTVGTMLFQVVTAAKLSSTSFAGGIIGTPPFGLARSEMTWNTSLQVNSTGLDAVTGAWPTTVTAGSGISRVTDSTGLDDLTVTGLHGARHTFALTFAFGRPIELDFAAAMQANGSAIPTGLESQYAYGNWGMGEAFTAWGGILSVRDSSGQLVSGFSALTSQGISYAQSFSDVVPEPATWALMGLGALVLPLLARRARRIDSIPPVE